MRFSTYINNQKCLEWGLNANQGALFDLLNQSAAWAQPVTIDNEVFYWVSKETVIEQLPLFYNKKDTVYRHFVELQRKGLIEYRKSDDKDLIRLTDKGKEWNAFNLDVRNTSDSNPTLGLKSEQPRIEIRNTSDSNPTDKYINNKNINKKTSQKNTALSLLAEFGITGQLADDFAEHRKSKKAAITRTALEGFQREADKAGIPLSEAIEIAICQNWQGFRADWCKNLSGAKGKKRDDFADDGSWAIGRTVNVPRGSMI